MIIRGLAVAAALSAAVFAAAPAAAQDAPAQFRQLLADHWGWYLKNNPIQASSLGVRTYDKELGDPSLAAIDRAIPALTKTTSSRRPPSRSPMRSAPCRPATAGTAKGRSRSKRCSCWRGAAVAAGAAAAPAGPRRRSR